MMKTYRGRCYNIVLCVTVLFFAACTREAPLQFCEGVTNEGKPVNCGTVFTTGDMTLRVKAKEPFGSSNATVIVYEKGGFTQTEYTRYNYTVNPDVSEADIPFSIYAEGEYTVVIMVDDKEIAKGSIGIVDTY